MPFRSKATMDLLQPMVTNNAMGLVQGGHGNNVSGHKVIFIVYEKVTVNSRPEIKYVLTVEFFNQPSICISNPILE